MLQTLAGHAFQVGVGELIGLDGAEIFVGHVGAGDAFVVARERNGYAVFHVNRQRMVFAADSENQVVGGQANFDENVAIGHFFQQTDGIFFIHDGNAVTDALGMAALDGRADVVGKIFGLHESHGKFTGVQGDVNFGIDAVQVIEHGHVLVEIVDGNVPVFGHDQVQADEMRIGGSEFEAQQDLGEDAFAGQAAERLIEIADGNAASGFGGGGAALQFGAGAGVVLGQLFAGGGGDVFQTGIQQLLAESRVIGVVADFRTKLCGISAVGSVHEFHVLQMIAAGAIHHRHYGFRRVQVRGQAELIEGGEEVVVAGFVARLPVAHGPGIDDLVVENV